MGRRLGALLPFARYRIEGASMAPSLAQGDRVVASRANYWFFVPKPGDVVVVRDPQLPHRYLIKRIASVADGRYTLLGDNADESTDSRVFGDVSRDLIVGKVLFRY